MTVNWGMIAPPLPALQTPQPDIATNFMRGMQVGRQWRSEDNKEAAYRAAGAHLAKGDTTAGLAELAGAGQIEPWISAQAAAQRAEALKLERDKHGLDMMTRLAPVFAHQDNTTPESHAGIIAALRARNIAFPAGWDDHATATRMARAFAAPQLLEMEANRNQIALQDAQLAQVKAMSPEGRMELAARFGIARTDPRFMPFVINGQLPANNPLMDLLSPQPAATSASPGATAVPAPGAAASRSFASTAVPGITVDTGASVSPVVNSDGAPAIAGAVPAGAMAAPEAASDPRAEMQRRIAGLPPDRLLALQIAAASGDQKKFMEILTGANPQFDAELSKKAADRYVEAGKAAGEAAQRVGDIDSIMPLISRSITGPGADWKLGLHRLLISTGAIKADPKVAATEQLDQYLKTFVGSVAEKYKPISNSDIAWIQTTLPNITNTPETLETVLKVMRRAAERTAMAEGLLAQRLRANPAATMADVLPEVDKALPQLIRVAPGAGAAASPGPASPARAATGAAAPATAAPAWGSLGRNEQIEALRLLASSDNEATRAQFAAVYGPAALTEAITYLDNWRMHNTMRGNRALGN